MAVRASDRSKLAADALDQGTAAAGFDVGVRLAKGTSLPGAVVLNPQKVPPAAISLSNSSRVRLMPLIRENHIRLD